MILIPDEGSSILCPPPPVEKIHVLIVTDYKDYAHVSVAASRQIHVRVEANVKKKNKVPLLH